MGVAPEVTNHRTVIPDFVMKLGGSTAPRTSWITRFAGTSRRRTVQLDDPPLGSKGMRKAVQVRLQSATVAPGVQQI